MAVKAGIGGANRELSSIMGCVGGVNRSLSSWKACVGGVNRELLGFVPDAELSFIGSIKACYDSSGATVSSNVSAPDIFGDNSVKITFSTSTAYLEVKPQLIVNNHKDGITYRIRVYLESGSFYEGTGGTAGEYFRCGNTTSGTVGTVDVTDISQNPTLVSAYAYNEFGDSPLTNTPNPIQYSGVEIASSYDNFEKWYPLPCTL